MSVGQRLFAKLEDSGELYQGQLPWTVFLPLCEHVGWDGEVAKTLWFETDTDNSGLLDKEEFMRFANREGVSEYVARLEEVECSAPEGAHHDQLEDKTLKQIKTMVDEIFEKYDEDQSGDLDENELKAFLREVTGESYNENEFGDVWRSVDTNQDGTLCRQEVEVFLKELTLKHAPKADTTAHEKHDKALKRCVKDIFRKFDTDNSQSLDKAELRKFLQETFPECYREDQFEQTFAYLDEDGSGSLDRYEVLDFLREVNYDPELIVKANAASDAVRRRFGRASIAGPKPPPRRTKKKAVEEAPPMVGKGGRYDKSGDAQVIRDLVKFVATPDSLVYIGTLCDAPFRSTLHRSSVEKLDELWMANRGKTLSFKNDIAPILKDQIPNLIKQYVNDSGYQFGYDAEVDAALAKICHAIIDGKQSFSSFQAMTIAFPPIEGCKSVFFGEGGDFD